MPTMLSDSPRGYQFPVGLRRFHRGSLALWTDIPQPWLPTQDFGAPAAARYSLHHARHPTGAAWYSLYHTYPPLQAENTTPVFQPVLLKEPKFGLKAGTMVFYTHKILNGSSPLLGGRGHEGVLHPQGPLGGRGYVLLWQAGLLIMHPSLTS